MRAPLSWLRELVDIPEGESGRDVAEHLIRAGLEVETVDQLGADLTGPLVVGEVLSFDAEEQKNGKTIRWCQVRVSAGVDRAPQGIVCGASNFAVGDHVVVALPGAELPGGFAIASRKTYGHVSDGMICSARELGMGDDHDGIIVLPADLGAVGDDAIELLGLRDDVLDIAVTPDRGYCFSMRGIAREAATAYGVAFHDPAHVALPDVARDAHEAHILDPAGADRIVLRTVAGFDPAALSPMWLQRRLQLSGMRPISLAVDITNYVMLETGQPLHAFDRAKLDGAITVRRAKEGESLTTLDDVERELHHEDLLIADGSGPLALAGTMGGSTTEVSAATSSLVIEAAHFDPVVVARQVRRHKLSTEASRRFERGVDHELAPYASARAVALLAELGGGELTGSVDVDLRPAPLPITVPADRASRTAGMPIDRATVVAHLESVGCAVRGDDVLEVVPPSWRPDLTDPADLDEEVLRLVGYDNIPSALPVAPAGRGLTPSQRLRRRVGMALAGAGFVEVLDSPFVGESELDALGLPDGDPRRAAMRLANPLSDEQPLLRTTLLPGLLATLRRNVGRGAGDLALFETGLVTLVDRPLVAIPRLTVDRRPTSEELGEIEAGLPAQPRHAAVVLAGRRDADGWWGEGRAESWADAIEAAHVVARAVGAPLEVRQAELAPWHPGRCAALVVAGTVVGHAGELHPRVVQALSLPERTSAMELDLGPVLDAAQIAVVDGALSTFPVATQDVALVVDSGVPAATVEAALRSGAGELLESVRLFDVYEGAQVGEGKKSLAYALRFRAADRTLTVEESTAARDAAVAEATARTGAVLRG